MNPNNIFNSCNLCNGTFFVDENTPCPVCTSTDTPIMSFMFDYLKKHRTVSVTELVIKTDLPYFVILKLLTSDKIWSSKELRPYCRLCGTTINISKKRLVCDKCCEKTRTIIFSAKKLGHIKKQNPINVKSVNKSGYIRYGFKLCYNESKHTPINECS